MRIYIISILLILVAFVKSSPAAVFEMANIDTSEFRRLVRTLKKDLITDYSSRILAPTGRIEVPYLMREMMKGF